MTSFAGWSLFGNSTSMLANYGQGLLLNVFFGAMVNAAQGLVAQISGQLSVFAATMLRAINPLIAKSEGKGDRELMIKASMTSSKVGFFLLTIVFIPVMIELPYLFRFWLKEVPEYTVIFCYLHLSRILVEQLYTPLITAISAVGNIKYFQIANSVFTLLPLPVSFLLFREDYAPYSLYVVFLIYSAFTFCVVLYFSKMTFNLKIGGYMKNVTFRCLSVLITSTGISILPILFIDEGLLRFLMVGIISSIAVPTMIWFVGLCEDERGIAKNMLKTIAKFFVRRVMIVLHRVN
jgi:Na+-driven multidrug efflux pump